MRWVDVFIHPSSGGTPALLASRSAHVLQNQTGATTRPRYKNNTLLSSTFFFFFVWSGNVICAYGCLRRFNVCLCAHVHILTTARLVPVKNRLEAAGHF